MSNQAATRHSDSHEPNTGAETTDEVPFVTEDDLRQESTTLGDTAYEGAVRSRG